MRSHVTAHLETHNENNVFECTECGLMLKTSSSLKGHVSQMHSTSYKHNCPICSRGFAKLDRYKVTQNCSIFLQSATLMQNYFIFCLLLETHENAR